MMYHAVLILAHNNFKVLEALLMQLDAPEFDVFLHINAKVKDFPKEHLEGIFKKGGSLHWVPRVPIGYCDYSMVRGVMSLFTEAMKEYHDYYHLISGADMMVKKHDEFLDFFARHKGKEFVGFSQDFSPERVFYRNYFVALCRNSNPGISRFYLHLRKWLLGFQKLLGLRIEFPEELQPRKGTDWYSITHKAAQKLIQYEPEFRRYFKRSYCPTEFLPQTILGNSREFTGCLYQYPSGTETEQCVRTIDWNRGMPYVYRISDFEELIHSPGMFARKFDENTDMEIVKHLSDYVCHRNEQTK